MDSTFDFSLLITATYWLAAAVALMSALMVVAVTVMRSMTRARERRLARFKAEWLGVFSEPVIPASFRPIRNDEITTFMIAWNDAQEAALLEGGPDSPVRARLNEIVYRLGMDKIALRLMVSSDIGDALSAILMLGELREGAAVPHLMTLVHSSDPIISFAASRALLQTDPYWAEQFVENMTQRRDWSRFKLLATVAEERQLLAKPLVERIRTADAAAVRELTQYLHLLDPAIALPVVRGILQDVSDPLTVTAALRVFEQIGEPSDVALAAGFAQDPDWRVRVGVANVLGHRGDAGMLPALQRLIRDEHWWVRYRAAQAIARIAASPGDVEQLMHAETDPFAREMLARVLLERSFTSLSHASSLQGVG